MAKLLGSRLKAYELTDQKSHADGVLGLKQAQAGFVVIFAHGSSAARNQGSGGVDFGV
jgi:hypothetical protein